MVLLFSLLAISSQSYAYSCSMGPAPEGDWDYRSPWKDEYVSVTWSCRPEDYTEGKCVIAVGDGGNLGNWYSYECLYNKVMNGGVCEWNGQPICILDYSHSSSSGGGGSTPCTSYSVDGDGDGHKDATPGSCKTTGPDCKDNNAEAGPNFKQICGNNEDNSCTGKPKCIIPPT